MRNDVALHRFWWLGLPLAMVALQVVFELAVPLGMKVWMKSETGPYEIGQALLMAAGFIVAVRCWIAARSLDLPRYFYAWIAAAIVGCFYVSGEEISWGQHFGQWATPDLWMERNDQGETNLHNTSSWLDQKPRLLLEIGVIAGGLIVPALQKFKPGMLPATFNLIYPPAKLALMSALVLGITILDKIDGAYREIVIMERASEVEELYIYYFVVLYLIILRRRVAQYKANPVI